MSVRTEQTLRRMWDESAKLAGDADRLAKEYQANIADAESHERIAAANRVAASAARDVGERTEAEAADLADLVNRERQAAGLAPLNPGDPYPVDPSPTDTLTDGLDTRGVEGNA